MFEQTEAQTKIKLSGSVFEKQKNRIEKDFFGASIFIKGTKVGTQAGKEGKYELDITSVADTAKTFTVICHFIGYEIKEVVFKKRVKKSQTLDFSMIQGPGIEILQEDTKNFNIQTK